MKTTYLLLTIIAFLFLNSACDSEAVNENPTEEVVENEVVEEDNSLDLLKEYIAAFEVNKMEYNIDSMGYECPGYSGFIKKYFDQEGNKLCIESLSGGEHGHELVRYFLSPEGQIDAVFHEEGTWIGDTDEITRTTYYMNAGHLLEGTRIQAKGAYSEMESLLANASPQAVTDQTRLNEIAGQYSDMESLTQETIEQKYCE